MPDRRELHPDFVEALAGRGEDITSYSEYSESCTCVHCTAIGHAIEQVQYIYADEDPSLETNVDEEIRTTLSDALQREEDTEENTQEELELEDVYEFKSGQRFFEPSPRGEEGKLYCNACLTLTENVSRIAGKYFCMACADRLQDSTFAIFSCPPVYCGCLWLWETHPLHAGLRWRYRSSGYSATCPDCAEENNTTQNNFVECTDCNETVCTYFGGACRIRDPNTRKVCDDCFRKYYMCGACGLNYKEETNPPTTMFFPGGENLLCGECFETEQDNIERCLDCDAFLYDGGLCNCYSGVIQNYNWRPDRFIIKTLKNKPPKLLMGVELELAFNDSNNKLRCAKVVTKNLIDDFFYAQSDGSISPEGYELVSHPFSEMWFEKEGIELFKEAFAIVEEYGGYANESCGMHVHTPKSAYSKSQVYKILSLMFRYPHLMWVLSGREQWDRLCRWGAVNNVSLDKLLDKANSFTRTRYSGGQHERNGLNLGNRDTAEFRIFGGTTGLERFCANLETVKSLYYYANTVSIRRVHEITYLKFVKERESEFRNLVEALRGYPVWEEI